MPNLTGLIELAAGGHLDTRVQIVAMILTVLGTDRIKRFRLTSQRFVCSGQLRDLLREAVQRRCE